MSRSAIQPGMKSPWGMRASDMPDAPAKVPPPARRRRKDQPAVEIIDPHRYGRLNGEQTIAVAAASPGTQVLTEPDERRNMLMMRNASTTANIYVAFGNLATTQSIIVLAPGIMILFDTVVPQDDVYAIADAASAFLTVAQSVIPY